MSLPKIVAECAFSNNPGDSVLTWVDVSPQVRGVKTQRGRNMELDAIETGMATPNLDNRDRRFDPLFLGVIDNLIQHPNFEGAAGVTGWDPWTPSGIFPSLSVAGDVKESGLYSMLIVAQNAELVPVGKYVWQSGAEAFPVTAGERFYMRCFVFGDAGWEAGIRIAAGTGAGSVYLPSNSPSSFQLIGGGLSTSTVGPDGVMEGIFTVPAGVTSIHFSFAINVPASTTRYLRVDNIMITRNNVDRRPSYNDGNQDNGRWEGTPNASRSYRGGPYYPNVLPVKPFRIRAGENAITNPQPFLSTIAGWNRESLDDSFIAGTAILAPPYAGPTVFQLTAGSADTTSRAWQDITAGLVPGRTYSLAGLFRTPIAGDVGKNVEFGIWNATDGAWLTLFYTPLPATTSWVKATSTPFVPIAGRQYLVYWGHDGTATPSVSVLQATGFQVSAPGALYVKQVYDLLRGDVEDWPQIWDSSSRDNRTEFNVLDAFDPLKDVGIPITFTRGAELSGARINAILDAAGWPAGQRSIDTGRSTMQAENLSGGTRKALEMLQEVALAESGLVFINGAGNFVFQDRLRREVASASALTLSNIPTSGEFPFVEARIKDSKDLIKNDIYVTIEGGVTWRASDAASIAKFRPRSYSITVPLNVASEGNDKAYWLLNLYKDAQYRVEYVKIAPQMDDNLWEHALGREIGDRVSVKVFPPGGGALVTVESVIERIEHDYEVGEWITTWFLSPSSNQTFWVAGSAIAGLAGVTTKAGY